MKEKSNVGNNAPKVPSFEALAIAGMVIVDIIMVL